MQPLGPAAVTAALSGLDAKLLVRLARDLLVVRGHTGVRETDGPGDATRDVFSVAGGGRRHLCQCKYHGDPSKAVTNNEVGELALGLHKHGYETGMFLTNARITSAAKRELIDNYPNHQLEFLDGQELFAAVLADEVLRSLWVEGEKVTLVSTRAAIPFIARVHDGDVPYALQANDDRSDVFSRCAAEIASLLPGVDVQTEFQFGCPLEAFDPYRPPTYLRFEEGGHHGVAAGELVLAGRVSAEDLLTAGRAAASGIAAGLSSRYGCVGVVAGRPFLLSGRGIRKEERTLTGLPGARFIALDGAATSEAEWFLPEDEPWSPACVANTSQTGSVRLYSRELDAALDYEIEVPVAPWERLLLQRYREGWERSVFVLLEADTDYRALDLPEPHATIQWTYENLELAWWRHEYFFRDGFVALPTVLRDDGLDYRAEFRADEAAEAERIERIRRRAVERGLRVVEPERARFMVALMQTDPLAEPSTSVYRTGDVFSAFDGIPSPIPPGARRFEAVVAWLPEANVEADGLVDAVRGALSGGREHDRIAMDMDHVVLVRRYSNYDEKRNTREVVAMIASDIGAAADAVELALAGRVERATKDYWSLAHGVELGRWWGQSKDDAHPSAPGGQDPTRAETEPDRRAAAEAKAPTPSD